MKYIQFIIAGIVIFQNLSCERANAQQYDLKNFDSCRVFATNYFIMYHSRVNPEQLMYDTEVSTFKLSKIACDDVALKVVNKVKYLEKEMLRKKELNRYSVDCRVIYLLYSKGKCDLLGFGSNGLMMLNDSVYEYSQSFLINLLNKTPKLKKITGLR